MPSRQAGALVAVDLVKVNINRRSIRNQIAGYWTPKLKVVEKNRETIREKRVDSSAFKIGLIGYTNAGKSTIMNLIDGW